jgi:hypothetical protein
MQDIIHYTSGLGVNVLQKEIDQYSRVTGNLWVVYVVYIIRMLPVVLHECETWSLTLREGSKLQVIIINEEIA